MDVFEFVLVLVSIIIGLAMTELFAGSVRIIRGDIAPYWIHWLWVLQLFLFQVQGWWWLWIFRDRTDWSFAWLVLILVPPALLYAAATLVFPRPGAEGRMQAFYYQGRRSLFLVLACLTASYVVIDWARFGVNPFPDVLRGVHIASLCVLAFTSNPRVHAAITPLLMAGLLYWVVRFTPDIRTLAETP